MKLTSRIKALALFCALAVPATAWAEEHLLATAELAQNGTKQTAELWGDVLEGGYARKLLLLVKDADARLVTAYQPTVKGGYNCLLSAVQVRKSGGQQLLLSVGQGDWQAPVEYRVLDFANPAEVRELFSASDSMGLVTAAEITDGKLYLSLTDGSTNEVLLPEGLLDGRKANVVYGGLSSLAAYDFDGDGQEDLLGSQRLLLRDSLLADVGAVWRLQDDAWQRSSYTIMTSAPTGKENTVNDGAELDGGAVLPRKLVLPGGEATYPVVALNDVALQNQINAVLDEESSSYRKLFFKGEADMAFKVLRNDALLLSFQLISGKHNFRHHHVHFDPATGERVQLDQILDVRHPDLLPLLRLLSSNRNVQLEQRLPAEWYMEGDKLFLVQNICGKDEATGYALGNLHQFLLDKKWLQAKEKTD